MAVKLITREDVHGIVERYGALDEGERSTTTLESYVREALLEEFDSDHLNSTAPRGDNTVVIIDHIVADLGSYGG